MPSAVSSANSTTPTRPPLQAVFQEFVAGTFFQQMLKALRQTHGEAAYFHGGQAERVFQAQFDQHVAGELAASHGGQLSAGLFRAFQQQRTGQTLPPVVQPASVAQAAYQAAKP
jgi:Rod binding domain-containing protein